MPEEEAAVEVGKTDFEFYSKFAKPLILTLNGTEDRILAASWFSKLRDESSGPDKLRLDYLKLLLFVLQRHRLAGPFTENPNAKEELEEFGEDYDLAAVARQVIEKEQNEKREHYLKKIRGEVGDWPPFSTDFSPDLKEYVAAQDIPNFGVHVYYAMSKDPILDWDKAEHAVFPREVRRMEPQGHISETSFAIIEPRPETPDEAEKCKILEETGVMPDVSIFLGRKARDRKSPYQDIDRPAPPLGVLPGEGEDGLTDQELPPPTWGSNLIEVREPLDLEGPETPPPEEAEGAGPSAMDLAKRVSEKTIPPEREMDPEDPEIVKLLETSFNMEDILAEVDAMETEEPPGEVQDIDPMILEEQQRFREMEADLDRHDAAIAEAIADLDEDEKRMLMEMEAEEAAGLAPKPKKPSPRKEVKLVADDDTVIKVLVESPEAIVETKEEKQRKDAKSAADKKKKPAGRTGLNKSKAKGALLKPGEKKEIEEQEKNAKVVETKTGIPAKRPGVPKPKSSKVKIAAAASEGQIPSEKPSVTGKGKGIPGKGVPKKGRAALKPPEGTVEMREMSERLDRKIQETKDSYPDKFAEEQMAGPSGMPGAAMEEEEGARPKTPVDDVATFVSHGSPESDDIYDEMDKEYQILERLYALYEQLAPDKPEGLRTPPLFSKHPQIRALGRQLRYRADEFDIHPQEKFQPAQAFFAGEGAGAPSPFLDPREAARLAAQQQGAPPEGAPSEGSIPEPPEAAPSEVAIKSPPWSHIEELKRIIEKAERGLETSPAISAKVGMTTPKSPSTPRRPLRRNLLTEFDMESPPPYESPPFSPEPFRTPDFVYEEHGLRPVLTQEQLNQMYEAKRLEHEEYIRAEMEAEIAKWPILAPKAPSPPPAPARVSPGGPPPRASPQAPVSPRTPVAAMPGATPPQMMALRPVTPPSVGAPGAPARTPGTPQGLPPSMRYQYKTPPDLRRPPPVEIPGPPQFEEFNPLEHEDIIYQTMPELVEADLDEFDTQWESPKFELKEWYDPMKAIIQAAEEEEGMFDMTPEMTEADLVPAEDDYARYSPAITLQERLMAHEIPQEFRDPERPKSISKKVTIGEQRIEIQRKSKPTELAQQIIEEDMSGEEFEQYEAMINEEEEAFLNKSIPDAERVEYIKKMAEEAQAVDPLEAEEPPFDMEEEISYGTPTPPPSPRTPPPPMYGHVKHALQYGSPEVPAAADERLFEEEEPEFLASPGMPTPPRPPTPPPPTPPPPLSPPWAPPPEFFHRDDIFMDEEEQPFLASPGMPPGRTLEDDLREIGSPIKPGPASWEMHPPSPPRVPVQVPTGPLGRPLGPGDIRVSPTRATGRGIPSPRRVRPQTPGSPEFDPEAFRRELMAHQVDFAQRDEFQAGPEPIPRRTPMPPTQYFPIREHAGFEVSQKLHQGYDDYREMMSRLPPGPPPAPYPEELMGQEHAGRFAYQEGLLDQPISPIQGLAAPLAPERGLVGWQSPPRLRLPKLQEFMASPPPGTPPIPPQNVFMEVQPYLRGMRPEGDNIMDMQEWDVFPEELQRSIGSPRVPEYLMRTPEQPPPTMAIPHMTMDQQVNQAEHRAQWQAQQIISPPRPSPPSRPPPRQIQAPRMPTPSPPRPLPPPPSPPRPSPPPTMEQRRAPSPKLPPCSRPSSPKVLKRMKEMSYTSEVYDPESPEGSTKRTRGRTMLEFNRPEEGERQRPVMTPPSQGVAVYPRGPPISAPLSPAAAPPMPMPMPMPRPMPPQRRLRQRIARPQAPGGTPKMPGGRLPRRNIMEGEGMGGRRRLFQELQGLELPSTSQAGPPAQSPRRVCPGAPKGEKIEIVEEYEETEVDYIPEHLRGFRWMDEPGADEFYQTFKQQFS